MFSNCGLRVSRSIDGSRDWPPNGNAYGFRSIDVMRARLEALPGVSLPLGNKVGLVIGGGIIRDKFEVRYPLECVA